MEKSKPMTLFNEQVTKALICKYFKLREHIDDLESVSIFAEPVRSGSIKPTKAKCTFCVKYKVIIAGFEQTFERWLDPEEVCRDLEELLLICKFKGNASVCAEVDDKVSNANSTEKDIGAHFEGILFKNIERIVEKEDPKELGIASPETESLNTGEELVEPPVIAEVSGGQTLSRSFHFKVISE